MIFLKLLCRINDQTLSSNGLMGWLVLHAKRLEEYESVFRYHLPNKKRIMII